LGDLGRERKKAHQKVDAEILSLGIETLYSLPTFAFPNLPPETVAHWPLSEPEAEELTQRVQTLLDSLPGKRKTKMMKVFETWGPWILLGLSGYLITAPRVSMTRKLLAQHRANNASTQPQAANVNANGRFAHAAPQAGDATGSGHAHRANGNGGNGRTGFTPFDTNPKDY
jgi:hypothetical protein